MKKYIIFAFLFLLLFTCVKKSETDKKASAIQIKEGDVLSVYIILDSTTNKYLEMKEGFTSQLDALLAEFKATAEYRVFETKLDPAVADQIKNEVQKNVPDLVCSFNNPAGFADSHIAKELKDPKYHFVSENVVPVETGVIKSWEQPSGNVCGVGVFVQLSSTLKLMKAVKPDVTKILSYSWDKMADINAWWDKELLTSCKETGFDLLENRKVASFEDEIDFLNQFTREWPNTAVMGAISPYVHSDGRPIDPVRDYLVYGDYLQNKARVPLLVFEDSVVRLGALMGACVLWTDLGKQVAELGMKVIEGQNPGSIPWEYPRKFSIIINKMTADRLGIAIPSEILGAAFRIYTDYKGNYIGQSD